MQLCNVINHLPTGAGFCPQYGELEHRPCITSWCQRARQRELEGYLLGTAGNLKKIPTAPLSRTQALARHMAHTWAPSAPSLNTSTRVPVGEQNPTKHEHPYNQRVHPELVSAFCYSTPRFPAHKAWGEAQRDSKITAGWDCRSTVANRPQTEPHQARQKRSMFLASVQPCRHRSCNVCNMCHKFNFLGEGLAETLNPPFGIRQSPVQMGRLPTQTR